ncbi:hypothetical protein AAC387_Pa06g0526 [Persea americana]
MERERERVGVGFKNEDKIRKQQKQAIKIQKQKQSSSSRRLTFPVEIPRKLLPFTTRQTKLHYTLNFTSPLECCSLCIYTSES